ncbi:MAG: thiamine pyrophosphate-dependent enzyme, partial [Acidobacteriota bacterium]
MTTFDREGVLRDYRIAWESRHASLIGRREVLTGKAKFGIFGDGKEVAQLALARQFEPGDWRSGYYRDQTFALATGMATLEELFAQLYADPDREREPMSGGRQMNGHFATHTLDLEGRWLDLLARPNSSADSSPTASQMPRLVGLAYASKLYRALPSLQLNDAPRFSNDGREIAFGTIGNASCAEGPFWEAINAVGVLGGPLVMSIWDDGYGISVANEHQVTKGDLSALLAGFRRQGDGPGYDLYTVAGWDYPALCAAYEQAAATARAAHVPAIVHVVEMTQPQGHSTSGSHERYKSAERLAWEKDHDCLVLFRREILERAWADEATLDAIEAAAADTARAAQEAALERHGEPIRAERERVLALIEADRPTTDTAVEERLQTIAAALRRQPSPLRRHLHVAARDALFALRAAPEETRRDLLNWTVRSDADNRRIYARHLLAEDYGAALAVEPEAVAFDDDARRVNGFEVLNAFFDRALEQHPNLVAFGEDVGQLGDVNQGMAGLQEKHGALRVADTGIRECTILGQAIGLAMRGLRPLCEIQYLDYIHYALQILSDDLATLRWRSRGRQAA